MGFACGGRWEMWIGLTEIGVDCRSGGTRASVGGRKGRWNRGPAERSKARSVCRRALRAGVAAKAAGSSIGWGERVLLMSYTEEGWLARDSAAGSQSGA